jgi:hypothetical protein
MKQEILPLIPYILIYDKNIYRMNYFDLFPNDIKKTKKRKVQDLHIIERKKERKKKSSICVLCCAPCFVSASWLQKGFTPVAPLIAAHLVQQGFPQPLHTLILSIKYGRPAQHYSTPYCCTLDIYCSSAAPLMLLIW